MFVNMFVFNVNMLVKSCNVFILVVTNKLDLKLTSSLLVQDSDLHARKPVNLKSVTIVG